jgi:hypothetical protein
MRITLGLMHKILVLNIRILLLKILIVLLLKREISNLKTQIKVFKSKRIKMEKLRRVNATFFD